MIDLMEIATVKKFIDSKQITFWQVTDPATIHPEFQNLKSTTNWVLTCPPGITFLASRPLTGLRKIHLMQETIDSAIHALEGIILKKNPDIVLNNDCAYPIGQTILYRGARYLCGEASLNRHIFSADSQIILTDIEHATRFWSEEIDNWKCEIAPKPGKKRYHAKIRFSNEGAVASGATTEKLIELLAQEDILPDVLIIIGLAASYEGMLRAAKKCEEYGITSHLIYNGGIMDMPYEGTMKRTDLPPTNMVTTNGILRKLTRRYQLDKKPENKMCTIGDVGDSIDPEEKKRVEHTYTWIQQAINWYNLDMSIEASYLYTYTAGDLMALHYSGKIKTLDDDFDQQVKKYLKTRNLI